MTYIERSRALSNDATAGGGFIGGNFGGNVGGRVSDVPIIQTAIEIEGPFSPHGLSLSDSRAKIFVCQPKNAAEERPCAETDRAAPGHRGLPPSRDRCRREAADEVL